MKKKLMSWILVFAMVLTLLPQTVFASATPTFGCRWTTWNNETQMDEEDLSMPIMTDLNGTVPGSCSLFFYYTDENGTETRLSPQDLTSSDENILTINSDASVEDLVYVNFTGFGDATIDYVLDGVKYSVYVHTELPSLGYYKTPEATEENYLPDFTVTDTNNTIYLVARYGLKITEISLWEDFAKIAEVVSIDESGTYATLNITGIPVSNHWYGAECSLLNEENENIGSQLTGITLYNQKSSVMYRWPDHNDGPVENPNTELQSSLGNAPGDSTTLFLYLVQGNSETRLSASDLTVSDENIIQISADWENPDAVRIEFIGFGSATIDYTLDGVTYSLDVNCHLPMIGFYSTPEASEETYLREFSLTEECDSFYLAAKDNWLLTSVTLWNDFSDIATVKLDESGKFATITVSEVQEDNLWYQLIYDAYDSKSNHSMYGMYSGISISSNKPGLKFRWASWNGKPEEDLTNELSGFYSNSAGYDNTLFFYFVDGENEVRLNASDLKSSDENVIQISADPQNKDAVCVTAVGFGDAAISYTVNGITYKLNVEITLPTIGYYTTPEAAEDTYIREFTVTDTENTFYLVAINGWEITDVNFSDFFGEIASCTLDESGRFAAIEVTGTPENNMWYELYVNYHHPEYNSYNSHSVSISLQSKKTSLMFAWDKDEELESTYYNEKGNCNDLYFYYVENGKQIPLTAANLVSSDESIVRIFDAGEKVSVDVIGWGVATIDYISQNGTVYSLKVVSSLPSFGYYKAPVASEEYWMDYVLELTDTNNTCYFVAKNGYSFDSFQPLEELEEIGEVTISEDRTVLIITITGTPTKNFWYGVHFEASDDYGNSTYGSHGFQINDLRVPEKPSVDVTTVFSDVAPNTWYTDSVQYVFDHNIMTGSDGLFSPNTDVTRAMVVETLYKMEGKPEITDFSEYDTMKDLNRYSWWANSVAWGMKAKIVTGDTYLMTFSPEANVTREQLATFLYRYANLKGIDTTLSRSEDEILNGAYVNSWSKTAFAWAVDAGIITGVQGTDHLGNPTTDLAPQMGATRAQLAIILQRFYSSF